jgi:hypothetical protein
MTQHCAGGLLRWIRYGFRTRRSCGTTKVGRELMKAMAGDPEERLHEEIGFRRSTSLHLTKKSIWYLQTSYGYNCVVDEYFPCHFHSI